LHFHREHDVLATLAVQKRETSRYLMFDESGELRGRGKREMGSVLPGPQPVAFCGIHVISPRLFSMTTEQGVFSIIDVYVRLASQGEKILAFHADDFYWRDLGKPENLKQTEKDIQQKILQL
jgi:NDP-sugar pyrophosphorylase family protein